MVSEKEYDFAYCAHAYLKPKVNYGTMILGVDQMKKECEQQRKQKDDVSRGSESLLGTLGKKICPTFEDKYVHVSALAKYLDWGNWKNQQN